MSAPLFLIAFAAGNLIGPLTLGHLFDTIGRKTMIAGTYIGTSAAYLTVSEIFPLEVRAKAIAVFFGVAATGRGRPGTTRAEGAASPFSA